MEETSYHLSLVCPECGEENVTVTHALCDCVGVEVARRSLHAAVSCPSERSARSLFIRELFKDDVRHEMRATHIRFVAAAVDPTVRLLERGADSLNSPALDADLLYPMRPLTPLLG